jgi:hypothetical protein
MSEPCIRDIAGRSQKVVNSVDGVNVAASSLSMGEAGARGVVVREATELARGKSSPPGNWLAGRRICRAWMVFLHWFTMFEDVRLNVRRLTVWRNIRVYSLPETNFTHRFVGDHDCDQS